MSQGYKICPICGTPSHHNAPLCSTCGAALTDVPIVSETRKSSTTKPHYDRRYGETDLLEGELRRRSEVYLFGGLLVLLAFACVGAVVFVGLRWVTPPATATSVAQTEPPTIPALAIATNTLPPPPLMSTVTPPPPTSTLTPTPGPCTRKVQPGDDLISIAWACGHRSLDVIPLILELNKMSSPDVLQVGQEIQVPWPTETPDTDSAAQNGTAGDVMVADSNSFVTATAFQIIPGLELASAPTQAPPTLPPTPTLLPGVAWHTVQANEDIAGIAYEYSTTLETLSLLNPEIGFPQCDFGSPTGGDNCMVIIQIGQQVRVPAPTPSPTLSPTLSGSETPTPTLTATFNAPSALSPGDRVLFMRGDLITLRWVASGTLNEGESYHVSVEDLTTGTSYSGDTTELFYIVPSDWQGQDGKRHDYRWTVSVIRLDAPETPYFTTEPRLFTWEGR